MDFKFKESAKKYLAELVKMYGDGSDRYKYHKKDQVFHHDVHGLTFTQHICMETHHSVMLIEGLLWDSGSIPQDKKIEQIVKEDLEVFKDDGLNNFILMHPELLQHIEGTPPLPHDLKGFTFINANDLFK